MHFFSLFTCAGRLSRRDYALTVGALLGFPPLLTLLAQLLFTPLVYLFSSIFFRESTIAFWVLLICCAILFITVLYTVLPLIAIPATVRRLHDMRHSGVFAAPLVLLALLPLTCFGSLLLLFLAAIEHLTGAALLPSFLQIPPPQDYDTLGILLVAVLPVLLALGLFLVCYTAWIFFEKGLPTENAYGAPPVQEPLPSVYTMFFTTQGAITRDDFLFRTLLLLAVVGTLLPTALQFTLLPLASILVMAELVPPGMDFYAFLLITSLYPLAAVPLVVRRLKTIGARAVEAVPAFAMLLPIPIIILPIAKFFGLLDRADDGAALDELLPLLEIAADDMSIACAALCLLCTFISIAYIMRLLQK